MRLADPSALQGPYSATEEATVPESEGSCGSPFYLVPGDLDGIAMVPDHSLGNPLGVNPNSRSLPGVRDAIDRA